MKLCKLHGVQNSEFNFCPHCSEALEDNQAYARVEAILPKAPDCATEIETRALIEARAEAWAAIGIRGPVALKLGESALTPKQLKEILEDHVVLGIGATSMLTIARFIEEDFFKFDQCYESLKANGSWTWKFARWYHSSQCSRTSVEAAVKRYQLKREYHQVY